MVIASSAPRCFLLFTTSLVLLLSSSPVTATDHIVGANHGWNPGVNYTLWANNQTFYVGDLISFRYQKNQYNVFQVNQSGYDNCTTDGATGNWTSGKDFILLDKAKRYYFICGNGQCFNGMKVSVLVHDLSPPPGGSAGNSSDNSAAERVLENAFGFASYRLGVLGLVAAILMGSGWF